VRRWLDTVGVGRLGGPSLSFLFHTVHTYIHTYIHNENVLLLPESTFLESGKPIHDPLANFFQSLDMSDTGAGSIVLSPEFCVCER